MTTKGACRNLYVLQDKQDRTIVLYRCRQKLNKKKPKAIEADVRGQKSSLITLCIVSVAKYNEPVYI